MKVPAAWITLSLTSGAAFAAAFFLSCLETPESSPTVNAVSAIAAAAAEREAAAARRQTENAGPAEAAGVLLDTRLREALAMTDLAAAIKHIMAHEGEDHCADTRLICLIEQLPASRLAELPAALAAHMGNDYVVRFVLSAWAQRDAAGALAWVEATPALNAAGTRAFLTGWMRGDADAALAWLDARPLSTSSDNLRTAAVEALAETNPAAALEMMKSRGWLANSPNALVKLLQNWGGSDPQAALDGLRSVVKELGGWVLGDEPSPTGEIKGPHQSFTILLRAMLLGAYERNPADAAALFAAFTADELIAGSDAFVEEVLARDPAAGAALFTANPDANTRAMLADLAQQNPALALQNLERIADPALRTELLLRSVSHFDDDVRAAVPPEAQATVDAILAGISDPKEHARAAARLAVDNASHAPQWAASLWRALPGDQQHRYGPDYLRSLVKADPDQAIAEFRQSPGEVQSGSLKELTYSLAPLQPAAALELVLEQTRRDYQAACAATLFARWAQVDAAAALAALEQHASQLDLPAIAEGLPTAGHLRVANGEEYPGVPTQPVAEKIQQLLGHPPSDE